MNTFSGEFDGAVVVAVAVVRVMQVAVHEIVNVIAVRHGLVTAAGAVDVSRCVAAAAVVGGAGIGVGGADGDAVFIHMVVVRMVQMAVVQIVDVAVMPDGGVAATRAVPVRVVGVVRLGAGIGHL